MAKRIAIGVAVALGALVAYLAFWPVDEEPSEWTAPPIVELPLDDALSKVEWLQRDWVGPEAIAFDADGGIVAGLADGRVAGLNTGGRPLGVKFGPDGKLYVADSQKGLLVREGEAFKTLWSGFADDLDFGADGGIYFSVASTRHDLNHFTEDLIEHQTTGELRDGSGRVVASGFQFANGVAFGPDPAWLVVAETGSYRLTRVWIADGRKETFIDSLPGFPDNVTWSKERQVFWVAIGSPRNALVDALAGHPWLRKMIFRLPKAVQPKPQPHAMVLAIDANGKIVRALQWKNEAAYFPVASAIERDGWLYLGSFKVGGYARVKL
jgi:hypothetical protein